MVDMHSHILPGIDDGAESVEESIAMLSEAYAQGVRYIVATPHCHVVDDEDVEAFLEKREQAYNTLKKALEQTNIPVPEILLGAEVALNPYLSQLSHLDKLRIGNTKCILLEPMFENMCDTVGEWIYEIGLKGLTPIVAHIERYTDEALEKMGIFQVDAIMQLNASALLTLHDRRRVRKFMKENRIFVMGSDMHNMHLRKCEIGKSCKRSKIIIGIDTKAWFSTNARTLLNLPKYEKDGAGT